MARKRTKPKLGRPVDEALQERRREQILEVATRLFAEKGYRKTETQAIADEIDVGKGTIYRYFPSKQELFLATVERGMRMLQDKAIGTVVTALDPVDRIRQVIQAYLAFFHDHPEVSELFIQERAEFGDTRKPTYFVYADAGTAPWVHLYEDLMSQGRIRKMSPQRIVHVLGDTLYGAMLTNYITGSHRSAQEQADDIIDVVFNGILSDRERKSGMHAATKTSQPRKKPLPKSTSHKN